MTRTRDHAGHLWTLTGDRWTAPPDLVVTTSNKAGKRTYSPGRDAVAVYDRLEDACKIEAHIAKAEADIAALVAHAEREREERERALADLARAAAARAEAREEAERAARRAAIAAREKRRRGLRWAAGLTVAAVALVVCAGVWGVSL